MKDIKVVASGDWHFGHPKIGTEQMYQELRKYFYPQLLDAQLCIITGDIYHQILSVNSKAHQYAFLTIADLLDISRQNGMFIRILHGTFTHDRDQLSIFNILNNLGSEKDKFKIINSISVEEIPELNLKIGYLPDNLPYKYSDEAIDQLKSVMSLVNFNNLSMLVGHGAFTYTLPPDVPIKPPCLYEIEQFRDIVHGPIVMGHIHIPSKRKNVYYCGSFERFTHGEEEKKGFYILNRNDNDWTDKFIVNGDANLFISIYPKGNDPAEYIHSFIDQVKESFPDLRGNVRVLHKSPEIRSLLHRTCSNEFPNIIYTSKTTGESDREELKIDEIELNIFDDVKPDKHNLGQLIWKYLEENQLTNGVTENGILQKTNQLMGVE